MRADLVVSSSNIASGFLEAPLQGDLVSGVAAIPDVAAVSGWRAIEWPYRRDSIGISAYDPNYFLDPGFGEWRLQGTALPDAWRRVARGEAVVVSTSFAQNFGVGTGDDLTLATPSGELSLPIAGVTVDFVSPRGTIEMSRDLFRRHWNDESINRVFVRTATPAAAALVKDRIAQRFGALYSLRVLSSGELMRYFSAQVQRAFAVIPILAGLVLLVVLVGMADTLAADVAERRQELGVGRAIGLKRRDLYTMVMIESVAICAVGLVLAAGCGFALAMFWVDATFTHLLGWSLELHVPVLQLLLASAVTLLVCILAALTPARDAARTAPALALRYE
jgi:putative ABC transport system permease protein